MKFPKIPLQINTERLSEIRFSKSLMFMTTLVIGALMWIVPPLFDKCSGQSVKFVSPDGTVVEFIKQTSPECLQKVVEDKEVKESSFIYIPFVETLMADDYSSQKYIIIFLKNGSIKVVKYEKDYVFSDQMESFAVVSRSKMCKITKTC